MSRNRVFAVPVLLLATAACREAHVVFADQIAIVPETDGQTAPAGARLPVPLAVTVRSNEGTPLPRVRVRWRAPAGAGSGAVSDSISVTDSRGVAQADFTLGAAPGEGSVRAEVAANTERAVQFRTTAIPRPALASVQPDQFTGGDVVTVTGTGLGAAALVEVGGAGARVLSGTATSLQVVVPICLTPGPVMVRAWVAGSASGETPGTYLAGPGVLALAPGDYASIDPARVEGCATFPAAGPDGAEYLIAPTGTIGSPGVSSAYRLVGDSVVQVTVGRHLESPEPTAAEAFHYFMRRQEGELARRPRVAPPPGAMERAPAQLVPPRVGDQRAFRVCDKVGCNTLADYPRIDARVRFVGEHVAIYQDLNVPPDGFSDADLTSLGQIFDTVLYDVATRAFGVESDLDFSGVVNVVLTPVVNGITPAGQCNAIFTGFFNALDLNQAFLADQRSNAGEVFYVLVPDPAGAAGCPVAKDRLTQVLPSLLIHEFQHMISYHQHVLLRLGSEEQVWLNEGLSELAEELGGLAFRDLGQDSVFAEYQTPNLYNAFLYLKAPGSHYTIFSGAGTLAERGSVWLFLRWLLDNFGADVPRRLVETSLVGQENLARATGEPLSRLLSQWILANYVSDLPSFTPPPRLSYASWALRTTFADLHQQQPTRFDRPFPLEPTVANGGTFSATGTLRAGSAEYFRIVQTGNQRGFTLRFTDPSGGPLATTVSPRLNVIRIR